MVIMHAWVLTVSTVVDIITSLHDTCGSLLCCKVVQHDWSLNQILIPDKGLLPRYYTKSLCVTNVFLVNSWALSGMWPDAYGDCYMWVKYNSTNLNIVVCFSHCGINRGLYVWFTNSVPNNDIHSCWALNGKWARVSAALIALLLCD